ARDGGAIQVWGACWAPLAALIFIIYMKTDWGISLFFLTPLALVAIPSLRLRRTALFRMVATWLVATLAVLAASPEEAKELGFIGICDTSDGRLPACEAWMAANADRAEPLVITTRRFSHGHSGPATGWKIYL